MKNANAIREMIGGCLAVRVRIVARSISAVYEQAITDHEVTIAQVNLLAALGGLGPSAPTRIGEVLQLERSTVSRNLNLLMQKGLIEGVEFDAKGIKSVRLSQAGHRKIADVMPDWRAAQKKAARLLGVAGVRAVNEASASLWSPPI